MPYRINRAPEQTDNSLWREQVVIAYSPLAFDDGSEHSLEPDGVPEQNRGVLPDMMRARIGPDGVIEGFNGDFHWQRQRAMKERRREARRRS